jgi:hypothetical protein
MKKVSSSRRLKEPVPGCRFVEAAEADGRQRCDVHIGPLAALGRQDRDRPHHVGLLDHVLDERAGRIVLVDRLRIFDEVGRGRDRGGERDHLSSPPSKPVRRWRFDPARPTLLETHVVVAGDFFAWSGGTRCAARRTPSPCVVSLVMCALEGLTWRAVTSMLALSVAEVRRGIHPPVRHGVDARGSGGPSLAIRRCARC